MALTKDDGPNRGSSGDAQRNAQNTANQYASGGAYRLPTPKTATKSQETPQFLSYMNRVGRPTQQQQQQQPTVMVTPAVTDFVGPKAQPQGAVGSLFHQEKPLAVEVVPQQKPVAIQAQEEQQQKWFNPNQAPELLLGGEQRQAALNIAAQYAANEKTGERYRKRLEREKADRKETTTVLTREQWGALSPLQQAAAQANYDLTQAVQRDLKLQNAATGEQVEKYQNRVKDLFGENSGTGFKGLEYAPNTIAFLDQRGLEAADLAGKTLDDLISGDALMDADTIKAIGEKVKAPDVMHAMPTNPREKNIAFAQRIAQGQLAFQEDLAKKLKLGDRLIADVSARATNAAAGKSYGALPVPTQSKLTAVRPEMAQSFDIYMEALARTDSPMDKAIAAINADLEERGASPEEAAQVYQGLIERTRLASTGEGKWFPGVDFPMRTPTEVAQALGAPVLKRGTTQGAE